MPSSNALEIPYWHPPKGLPMEEIQKRIQGQAARCHRAHDSPPRTLHRTACATCGGEVQSEEDRFSAGHSRREGNYLISYWCTGVTCRINKSIWWSHSIVLLSLKCWMSKHDSCQYSGTFAGSCLISLFMRHNTSMFRQFHFSVSMPPATLWGDGF